MSRERRFEQKQNAKRRRLRIIWRNMSENEKSGVYRLIYPSLYYEGSRFEKNDLDRYWRRWATGINYASVPSAWNNRYHTRPARARCRQCRHQVLRGNEEVIWPHKKRPTIYYW